MAAKIRPEIVVVTKEPTKGMILLFANEPETNANMTSAEMGSATRSAPGRDVVICMTAPAISPMIMD